MKRSVLPYHLQIILIRPEGPFQGAVARWIWSLLSFMDSLGMNTVWAAAGFNMFSMLFL